MRLRAATAVITAAAVAVLAGACGSAPAPGATASPDLPTTVVITPPSSVEATSADVDTPACTVLTADEVATVLGAPVTEVAVESPEGCQWLGGATVNVFRFPAGDADASMTEFERTWKAYEASVTAVPGLGDRAIAVERAKMPTRYLAVQAGEEGLQFQSTASADQLVALGELVVARL